MRTRTEHIDYLIEECFSAQDFLDSPRAENLTHYEITLFEDAINKCISSMKFIRTQRIEDYYKCVRCFKVDTGFHNVMCDTCKEFYNYSTHLKNKE